MQPALSSNLTLAPGSIAIGFDVALCRQQRAPARSGRQWQAGRIWAVAPMLPAGTESWSLRLAGGADLASADTRACCRPCWPVAVRSGWRICIISRTCRRTAGRIAHFQRHPNREGRPGHPVRRRLPPDLVLRHLHGRHAVRPRAGSRWQPRPQCPGAGRLQPEAGQRSGPVPGEWPRVRPGRGSARYEPLVTAVSTPPGTRSRAATSYRRAGQYACRHPGIASGPELSDKRGSGWMSGGYTGTWLWRQGGEDLGQRTAWWINFGTYVPTAFYSSIRQPGVTIEGFTGIGALGGGNVDVAVGGDAGIQRKPGSTSSFRFLIATAWCWRWEARDGSRRTAPASRRAGRPQPEGERRVESRGDVQLRCRRRRQWRVTSDMNGVLTNLRGALDVSARSIGRVDPMRMVPDPSDSRPMNTDSPTLGLPLGA